MEVLLTRALAAIPDIEEIRTSMAQTEKVVECTQNMWFAMADIRDVVKKNDADLDAVAENDELEK